MDGKEPCEYLSWDSRFFGRRIARISFQKLDSDLADSAFQWCEGHRIDCAYFLAVSDDIETVRLAEKYGFRFVDIRVTLTRRSPGAKAEVPREGTSGFHLRPSKGSDVATLRLLARKNHEASRFYADPGFARSLVDEMYGTWIEKSCEGFADIVLVADMEKSPVGYISCNVRDNPARGVIGLVGVDARVEGMGIGRSLVGEAIRWFASKNVDLVSVVTQGRNIPAQRLYQSCGFMVSQVELWYHKWW